MDAVSDESLENWANKLEPCYDEFMGAMEEEGSWDMFADMTECEANMVISAILFSCAADGDEVAMAATDCFISNDDCLSIVCEEYDEYCFCDDLCEEYEDCCEDMEDCPPEYCFCDDYCVEAGDCCDDEADCPEECSCEEWCEEEGSCCMDCDEE